MRGNFGEDCVFHKPILFQFAQLGKRLDDLWIEEPIAYRKQNGGDYEIPALTLKPGLGDGFIGGFRLHRRSQR